MAMDSGETIWEPGKLRLFVSHTSANKQAVAAQKFGLAMLGVDAFVAHEDIDPSLEWQDVIESALLTCDALVAWLTPDFLTSNWTDQEIGFCLARQTLIIPVRVGLDPYGFIGKYQGLQAIGKEPFAISREIVETLAKSDRTARQLMGPAARTFVRAGSFDMARTTFKTLNLLPIEGWTSEDLDELEDSPQQNNQIEHGVYEKQAFPDLLRHYVAVRRPRARLSGTGPGSGRSPTIECRGEVERIGDVFNVNGRVFRTNRSVWLYVKNHGPTAEFSVRFWNVQGLPVEWGANYGVRHVSWEGGRATTRPEIDGYGGERRVKVANVALTPLAFWFYTTENGVEECGSQALLAELYPTLVGHNFSFQIEIVNQASGEKLLKQGFIVIVPSIGEPRFEIRDTVIAAQS
jgi:hypothetical protein